MEITNYYCLNCKHHGKHKGGYKPGFCSMLEGLIPKHIRTIQDKPLCYKKAEKD